MPNKTLHLSFDDLDRPDGTEDEVFVISEDLSDECDWFSRFSELNVSQESIFSYDIFWPHLVISSRGNLLIYAMLYSNLSRLIDQHNINYIISHDLEKGYRHVTDDLAEKHNITIEHKKRNRDNLLPTSKILLRASVVFLIFDQIFSIMKEQLSSSDSLLQHRPLFFPYPGRYKSMLPVIREMERPSNIIVTPLTISWRLLNPASDWPENNKTRTLSEFSDFSTIKRELTALLTLQKKLLIDDLELTQKVDEQLQEEYDVQISRTIEYVCQDILHRDIRLILSLYLIENAVEQIQPESIIVGGMNPRDRYMLEVGDVSDANLFYIPHSIAYSNEIVPQIAETTHFVSGGADERVIKNQYSRDSLPNIQPLGRPYLDEVSATKESTVGKETQNQRIIIATQPYPNWIRKKFLKDILKVINDIEYSGNTIIKTHPSESPEYYRNIIERNDSNISVMQGEINSYINKSTTLLTINSNVGIESILAGAFCISYNPFEPFINPPPYIDGEHVPYARTTKQLQNQIESSLKKEFNSVENQVQFIQDSYALRESSGQISKYISDYFL